MARRTKYTPQKILDLKGSLLSGELAQILSEKHGVSIAAAKKGFARAYKKGMIKRLEFMTFGKGEHLYYSKNTSRPDLLRKVLKTIAERRPIIHRLWKALKKEKILPHRDGLKITGLPTKRISGKESYLDVVNYLIELGLAFNRRIDREKMNIGFLVLNTKPPIGENELALYAKKVISKEKTVNYYLRRAESVWKIAKNVRKHRQVGSRLFDAIGLAVSPRYIIVVFDFNLIRRTEDYVIEGLLDRIFSVYRKKFKQIVIAYCISEDFSKAAQHKAITGRLKQLNLIKVKIENGRLITKRIDGISKNIRGGMFENQIRYILEKSGFRDVQRGLKIYRNTVGVTEKLTSEEFTDIDIIAHYKKKKKVIICELKNWHIKVPQKQIEAWVQDKLNVVIDYLQNEIGIDGEIEAWYIVSKKPDSINEDEIRKKCKCKISVLSKIEFIDNVIGKLDRYLANELKPIVLY